MADVIIVPLGGRDWTIGRLNLGQLRALKVGTIGAEIPAGTSAADREIIAWDYLVGILAIGLSVSGEAITPADIYAMPVTLDDVIKANDAILGHAGLKRGKADAAAASTGDGSTAI
jgi:hypothetical protein